MSSRPRVLIDGRMLLGRFSGVARFVTRLVENLVVDDAFRIAVLCGDEPYAPWNGQRDVEQILTDFTRRDRTPVRRLRWESRRLPEWIQCVSPDLFHATWNSGVPLRCPVPTVLTIHDLIPWHEPPGSLSARLDRAAYRRAVRRSAGRATRTTAVSAYTRTRLIETLKLPEHRVDVVHNGVDRPRGPTMPDDGGRDGGPVPPNERRPYVLYVGGFEPRKNIAGVFRAMRSYWDRFGHGLVLRLTGSPGRLGCAAADVLKTLPSAAPVQFLGELSDAELARQYREAAALLFLSYDEGFGLPALEAMAHGCPVIAADRTALREVVADAGVLVDPDDPAAAAGAVAAMTAPSPQRSELVRRGLARADGFSWARAAAEMADVYRRALSSPAGPAAGEPVTARREGLRSPARARSVAVHRG